jgi:DsbC/DsbD-like thiol-disulfide interchange protein
MMIGIDRLRRSRATGIATGMASAFPGATLALSACALLISSGILATSAAPATDDVSRWDGDARSAARLIAGSPSHDAGVLRAGIEVRLKHGWHTYWRYPGDSGVPPQFDFKESQNVKSVDVLWPAPQRLAEAGGISIGYATDVILPLRVVPKDAAKPVMLRLKLGYAICEKLCVPAEAHVELALPKGSHTGIKAGTAPTAMSQDAALAAAEARVPHKVALGKGGGLIIRSVHREPGAARPRVLVDLEAPADLPVDLFAEGPTSQWALPLPMPADGAPVGLKRFVFEIDGVPPGASDQGVVLTLTAVTPQHAIEVAARLD